MYVFFLYQKATLSILFGLQISPEFFFLASSEERKVNKKNLPAGSLWKGCTSSDGNCMEFMLESQFGRKSILFFFFFFANLYRRTLSRLAIDSIIFWSRTAVVDRPGVEITK